jgi:hypothetical protein
MQNTSVIARIAASLLLRAGGLLASSVQRDDLEGIKVGQLRRVLIALSLTFVVMGRFSQAGMCHMVAIDRKFRAQATSKLSLRLYDDPDLVAWMLTESPRAITAR